MSKVYSHVSIPPTNCSICKCSFEDINLTTGQNDPRSSDANRMSDTMRIEIERLMQTNQSVEGLVQLTKAYQAITTAHVEELQNLNLPSSDNGRTLIMKKIHWYSNCYIQDMNFYQNKYPQQEYRRERLFAFAYVAVFHHLIVKRGGSSGLNHSQMAKHKTAANEGYTKAGQLINNSHSGISNYDWIKLESFHYHAKFQWDGYATKAGKQVTQKDAYEFLSNTFKVAIDSLSKWEEGALATIKSEDVKRRESATGHNSKDVLKLFKKEHGEIYCNWIGEALREIKIRLVSWHPTVYPGQKWPPPSKSCRLSVDIMELEDNRYTNSGPTSI